MKSLGRRAAALTIAGSDPSGGAGVQADVTTFRSLGVRALSAVTAITAQDGARVRVLVPVEPATLVAQLDGLGALVPQAAKTGMLATEELAATAAWWLRGSGIPMVVVDPVLRASGGTALFEGDVTTLLAELGPLATLITPNLAEAAALTGVKEVHDRGSMQRAAEAMLAAGCRAVLVTGGHLYEDGRPGIVADLLVDAGGAVWYEGPRIAGPPMHGTGCALSAAVTAGLARGIPLREAIDDAKRFVARAIEDSLRVE